MRCFLLCIGCLLAAAPVRCAEEPAAAKPPEADAPWHVPIPAAGPEVAFVWNDFTRYKPDKHLFVMQDLWLPATFAAAGYRPRILLSPAMAADPRVRRALKMCDYEALAVTLDEQTDLKRFALVVGPSSTFWPPPSGLVPALERYVREGGRYIHPGLSLEPEAEWFRFLGIESNARAESVPLAVAPGDQHPLSAGLDGPLRPARDQTTMALGKPLPRGSVPLTHANSQVPFLRVWDEGQGKVVHINTEFYASRRHALGREGLMLADLVLRAADWLIGSPPRRPWSTTRQRVALLKETDQLKPAGKDALLFSTSFDDKADLDAWTLWDTKSPATTDRKSDWWIDTNMGALVESSNIYSGVGVGTRAVIGRPEWANYVISATLACHDDDEFGIIFRYQDEGNYYRLFLDADTIAQVRLQKRRNGQLETLDGVSQPYLPGVPVRYQIAMRDDNLVVATNGKPILMVNDPDFRSGRAGVETSGSDWVVTYDFEVFALDGAPARTGQAVPQTPEGGAPAAAPPAAGSTYRVLSDWHRGAGSWIGVSTEKPADSHDPCGRVSVSRAYARLEAVPHDWSAVDALEIEVRAGRATGEKVRLLLPSDNPATPGTDRYAAAFVVGWVGWKRLRWTRSDLQAEGKPLGWQQIDNVTLAGERWGKPGAASLWLGEVAIRGHAGK